jgi:hypothetical protein
MECKSEIFNELMLDMENRKSEYIKPKSVQTIFQQSNPVFARDFLNPKLTNFIQQQPIHFQFV